MVDYKAKNKKYGSTKLAKQRRAALNTARRRAIKKYGKAALKGKDVDHIRTNPGGIPSNDPSNLRIVSVKFNRGRNNNSWRTTKKKNY